MSAVEPSVRFASTFTPNRMSREAMASLPRSHAAYSGVRPSLALRFTSARSSRSSCKISRFPFCAAAKIGENPAFVKRFAVARWRLSSRRAHSSDPALHAMYRGERPSVAHVSGEARWMSNNRHSAAFPFSQTLSSGVLPLASFLSTSTTSHADGGGSSVTTDCLSFAHIELARVLPDGRCESRIRMYAGPVSWVSNSKHWL